MSKTYIKHKCPKCGGGPLFFVSYNENKFLGIKVPQYQCEQCNSRTSATKIEPEKYGRILLTCPSCNKKALKKNGGNLTKQGFVTYYLCSECGHRTNDRKLYPDRFSGYKRPCPNCDNSSVAKTGFNRVSDKIEQKYHCSKCGHNFKVLFDFDEIPDNKHLAFQDIKLEFDFRKKEIHIIGKANMGTFYKVVKPMLLEWEYWNIVNVKIDE